MSRSILAWKFLDRGALGPFTGFAWPRPEGGAPGAWVEAEGPLAACERGIHACRDVDLAFWIGEELWRVELGGELADAPDGVVARRARLLSRHERLDEELARLAQASADRAAALASHPAVAPLAGASRMLADAGNAAGACYLACVAAGIAADPTGADERARRAAFRAERAWQSAHLAAAL